MLHPFAPETIDKLRVSLNLPEDVYQISELAQPIAGGHKIGEQNRYFPPVTQE